MFNTRNKRPLDALTKQPEHWLDQFSYIEKNTAFAQLQTQDEMNAWVCKKKIVDSENKINDLPLFNFVRYEFKGISQERITMFSQALLFNHIRELSFIACREVSTFTEKDWQTITEVIDKAKIQSLTFVTINLLDVPADLWPLACRMLSAPSLTTLNLSRNKWSLISQERRELFYDCLEQSHIRSLIMRGNGLDEPAMLQDVKRLQTIIGRKMSLKNMLCQRFLAIQNGESN